MGGPIRHRSTPGCSLRPRAGDWFADFARSPDSCLPDPRHTLPHWMCPTPLSYRSGRLTLLAMPSPTITVRLPEHLHAALKTHASKTGQTVTSFVTTTLQAAIGPMPTTSNPTTTPQRTGMTVPSPAPKPSEPAAPIQAEHEKGGVAQMAERAPQVTGEVGAHRRSGGGRGDVGPRQGPSVPPVLAAQSSCPPPPARQRNIVSGKKCLDCGEIVKGFF